MVVRGRGGVDEGEGPFAALAHAAGFSLAVPLVLVSLVTPDGGDVAWLYEIDRPQDPARRVQATSLCRTIAHDGKPVIRFDVRGRLTVAGQGYNARDIAAYAGVPVVRDGRGVGAIAALGRRVRPWSGRDVEQLRRFAAVAATIVAQGAPLGTGSRSAELESLALHDELTGLLNRRGFYAVAGGQLAIARRKRMPGMVFFVDIDGLKTVNDRGGHAAGDSLLRRAGGVLRATFRESDTIARFGGDEFVVLSIDTTEKDIAVVIERLAGQLSHANEEDDAMPHLRWSVGHVYFDAATVDGLENLIGEADRRMYAIKRTTHGVSV
jgi:diguanylate cyclase (GGDEF)-like protein